MIIPCGVCHAVRNIGTTGAIFVNMTTRAYEHEAPDTLRLPLDTRLAVGAEQRACAPRPRPLPRLPRP